MEKSLEYFLELEEQNRLVILPVKSQYGNKDLDESIRYASYCCGMTNNDYNRYVVDALIKMQIDEEEKVKNE